MITGFDYVGDMLVGVKGSSVGLNGQNQLGVLRQNRHN